MKINLSCIVLSLKNLYELLLFRSSGGGSGGLSGLLPPGFDLNNAGDSDLQSLLNNMSQSQLMQIFGGVSGGAGIEIFFT